MQTPLIWFGGKSKLADDIIRLMPQHKCYVEPFGGGGGVIAAKEPVSYEVFNDVDSDLVNFLMVLREQPHVLAGKCITLPYSRQLYNEWKWDEKPEMDDPVSTVTTVDHNALVVSHLTKMYGTNTGQRLDEPLHTVTAGGNHFGEVRAFLTQYNGSSIGQTLKSPINTISTHDRFGLVTVKGQDYAIVDIGMRMLEPHELFAAQGFPEDYVIDVDVNGKKYPKSAQVARCGNAVPPPFAEALVRANLPELCFGQEPMKKAR